MKENNVENVMQQETEIIEARAGNKEDEALINSEVKRLREEITRRKRKKLVKTIKPLIIADIAFFAIITASILLNSGIGANKIHFSASCINILSDVLVYNFIKKYADISGKLLCIGKIAGLCLCILAFILTMSRGWLYVSAFEAAFALFLFMLPDIKFSATKTEQEVV